MNVLIRYSVPADKVEENKAAVNKFIDFVKSQNDPDMHYTSYQLKGSNDFAHLPECFKGKNLSGLR